MTSNIIYHDFTKANMGVDCKADTSPAFEKAFKYIKATKCFNNTLNRLCLFLCGMSVGISILVFLNLLTIV